MLNSRDDLRSSQGICLAKVKTMWENGMAWLGTLGDELEEVAMHSECPTLPIRSQRFSPGKVTAHARRQEMLEELSCLQF